MSHTPSLPDQDDRRAAATDFDRNIVVEAGAGTGKTSLLVERLLVALGSGRVSLHQVAAITFTEKAAGEIRERLGDGLESLRALAAGDVERDDATREDAADRAYAFLRRAGGFSDEGVRSRAVDGLRALDRATVTTVHGFCAEILRAHPFEAGISPEFQIERGEQFAAAFPEAWEEFLSRELGAAASRTQLWARVLAAFDLPLVEKVARALSRSAIPASVLEDDAPWPDARVLLGGEAAALVARIDRLLAAIPGLGHMARAFLDAARPVLHALAERGLDPGLRAALGGPWLSGNAPGLNKTIPPEREREFRELVAAIRSLLRPLAWVEDEAVRDVVAVTAPFARDFRESLVAAGFVDFDGLLSRARDVLARHLPVREAVKARYSMLLVDEFQDTDPLQYDIVLYLAERVGGRASDPFHADLAPGRLFIVGDPKQSIYRFRGADYAAYRRAVARVLEQDGRSLTLTASFRALPEVLAPINALFGAPGGGWEVSDFQPPYRRIDPVRDEGTGGAGIELWSVLPSGASAARRRHAEGSLIARRIHELRHEQERPWKDFTILLRAFTDVSRYVRPLREAGIPFVVTGGRAFHGRTEVVRLLAHLRLLASPDDPPALLAWLRSPAGAVPDTELASWALTGGSWGRSVHPDPARWPNLARALDDWRALDESVRDLPLDAVIRRTLEASFLPVVEGFAFEGAQRVANLRKLATRACELAADGRLSLAEIVDGLEERSGYEPEGESPLADENTDAVRVLTVHAAKGLESPIVFVPDLARGDGDGYRDDVEAGVLLGEFGAALALQARRARNASHVAWRRENDRHGAAEGMRLLYVALTRARDRIIVLAGSPAKGSRPEWLEPLAAWGYRQDALPPDGALLNDGRIVHRVMTELPAAAKAQAREITGAPEAVIAYARTLQQLSSRVAHPPLQVPSGLSEEIEGGARENESSEIYLARDPARAVGTAVHRLLERWHLGVVFDPATIAAVSQAAATERRCDPVDVERGVVAIFDELESRPFAKMLAAAREVMREVPLIRRDDDGTIWRGRADLILRDTAGEWVVVDFKTDGAAGEAELIARHAPQLRVYALALRDALHLPRAPSAQLWMLRSGAIVDIAV